MNKNNWIIGGMLSIFLCATVVALGQQHRISLPTAQPTEPPMSSGMRITPLTSAAIARAYKEDRLNKAAIAALRVGDYTAEEDYARQSMAVEIGSGLNQELLAQALYDQGKDQEAFQVYEAMWKEGETSPDYVLPYALLLLKSGQWAQAVAAYNRALPYLNQGELVQAHNNFSPNVPRILDLATAIHIGLGVTYLNGNDWGGRDQHAKAMLHFRQALALSPNNALANYQYGIGLMRVGNPVAAKAALQEAAWLGQHELGQTDVTQATQAALQTSLRRNEYLPPVIAR